jgi:hypothetical protein
MVVYRGNFDEDLSRQGAPKYKALLRKIYEVMHSLEREGRIMVRVDNEIIGTNKKYVTLKRYTAVGVIGGI